MVADRDRDVRRVTSWDRKAAATLQAMREELGLTRPQVVDKIEGLVDTTLQNMEKGNQRISLGLLMELCGAMHIDAKTVLLRAGLIDDGEPTSLDDYIGRMPLNPIWQQHIKDYIDMVLITAERERSASRRRRPRPLLVEPSSEAEHS